MPICLIHKNSEITNRLQRIDITDYLNKFIFSRRKEDWWWSPKLNSLKQAIEIKDLLNDPANTSYKSLRSLDGTPYWHIQLVDFISSNLGEGRGYLFYFICNGCKDRVKYLYEYSMCETPLCRQCCRLRYRKPTLISSSKYYG